MILLDFLCEDCNNKFEELVDKDTRFQPCPECGSPSERTVSAVALGKFSMASPEQRADMLKKRSMEHTQKTIIKHEYNKFGMKSDGPLKGWNLRKSKKETKSKNKK